MAYTKKVQHTTWPALAGAVLCSLTLLLCCVHPTSGILCVQCISESNSECVEHPPAPVPCDHLARYCIVVRESLQHNASVVTVTRTCSPVDLGSKCHDSFSLAGESVLVCHTACDTDGCNGASNLTPGPPRPNNKNKSSKSNVGSTTNKPQEEAAANNGSSRGPPSGTDVIEGQESQGEHKVAANNEASSQASWTFSLFFAVLMALA